MRLETRKITINVPINLLNDAQHVTGEGITETVRTGLEQLAQAHVYQKLLSLEGTCKLDIDLEELRKDKPLKI